MVLPRSHVPLSLLSLLFLTYAAAWYDENCGDGGQCTLMFKNYETLMRGQACRSFYYTGQCSRLCTYSLKSLTARHTWSKCAERCEWSTAVTDAIASWLDMCLANPAPDVFQSEDADDANAVGSAGGMNPKITRTSIKAPSRINTAVHWVIILVIALLFLLSSVAVATNPELKRPLGGMLRRTVGYVRRLRNRHFGAGRMIGRGPLDVAPDRNELRNLQRGARRHLKALRTNLD